MAGKGLRHWQSPEQAEAAEGRRIELLAGRMGRAERIGWLIAWRDRHLALVASYTQLAAAYEAGYALLDTRGERWRSSYTRRWAERQAARAAAQARAYATALAALELPDYDAPEGAGEAVEAYRG